MEIFYNASHLWTSAGCKLYYTRKKSISNGIISHVLNRFSQRKKVEKINKDSLAILYVPWNKIYSTIITMATFFIIMQAYVGMSTNSEASSWAEWSSPRFTFILITGLGKEDCDLCQRLWGFEASRASLQLWLWICKALIFSLWPSLFQIRRRKRFGNIMPHRAITELSYEELRSARMKVFPCFSIRHTLLDEQFCLVAWS